MNLQSHSIRIVGAALLVWFASPAAASNFNVKPVRIEFTKAKMNSVIQIANLEDTALRVQVSTLSWTNDGEKDVYTPVDDILLNPPVFEIPAHGTQYMRLGLRRLKDANTEQAYRLILAEVPKALEPGFQGMRTVVRISIPIFVKSEVPGSPQLSWEARKNPGGGMTLTATNRGTVHIEITHLLAVADEHGEPVSQFLNTYLLPGQKHEWKIDDPRLREAMAIDLTAKTDAEDSHAHVLVAEP